MDFKKVSYYVKTVQLQSFSRAAEALYLSQPMLSKAIRQLEEEVGAQLIDRSSKHFHVTDEGERFYKQAVRVLSEHYALEHVLETPEKQVGGLVRIGAPESVLSHFVSPIFRHIRDQYPEVRMEVIESGSLDVLENLLNERVDIGIVMLPVPLRDVDVTPLYSDRAVLLVSGKHPLAGRRMVEIGELVDESFVLFNSTFTLSKALMNECYNAGFVPQIRFQSASENFIFAMVEENVAVSIFPRPLVKARGRNIKAVELTPPIPWNLALLTKKGGYLSRAAAVLRDEIIDHFEHDAL